MFLAQRVACRLGMVGMRRFCFIRGWNLMNRQELLASLRRLSVMAGSFCMSGTNLLPDCGAAASARHALNLWSKKVRKTWLIANLLGCRHAEFGEPKRSG